MYFELSSLGKEFKKKIQRGGKESKIWNYIHPWLKVCLKRTVSVISSDPPCRDVNA